MCLNSNQKDYLDTMAEHVKPYSWLKFPYIKELGYPDGVYRVAPLSRINAADKCLTQRQMHRNTQRIQRHLWIRTANSAVPLARLRNYRSCKNGNQRP